MKNKLYVGNLAYSVTDATLADLFAQAGVVKSATVIIDRETRRSKGFGFVEMGSDAEAEKAIGLLHDCQLENRSLAVNIARPREESGPRPRSSGGERDADRRSPYGSDRNSGGRRW